MSKSNIINIHGGHSVIDSRGAVGYLDEVNVDKEIVKYIKEYLKKHGYVLKDCSVKSSVLNGIDKNEIKNIAYDIAKCIIRGINNENRKCR